jgi:hypothetical protein
MEGVGEGGWERDRRQDLQPVPGQGGGREREGRRERKGGEGRGGREREREGDEISSCPECGPP